LGLDTVESLRSFCLELSKDKPSPGGGTASAAAGAMAASLLVMVCDITMRSKKHESSRPELMNLKPSLLGLRDELISLSLEDARAYDLVVDAVRARKENARDSADRDYQAALKHASEVPQKTATACLRVLETAVAVAGIGTRSASSDVGVAALLADAGFGGAAMNVKINLGGITDRPFVKAAKSKLDIQKKEAKDAVRKALAVLAER
jgi:formiminotetrahydrofolate cyclodeaminase